MTGVFFIVGPTGVGKSDIAAAAAVRLKAEIVSCDAFQIYEGFDILSGKPDSATLAKVRHHLVGSVSAGDEMNAGRFVRLAIPVIDRLRARGRPIMAVGGSGLYLKAMTHGLDGDWRQMKVEPQGFLLLRDRDELRGRINRRVEEMFERGAVKEVEKSGETGPTASKMIGLREIRAHLAGDLSLADCIQRIQVLTRQYAKRQLTWFRHQTNFEPLNLSLLTADEAVERVVARAGQVFATKG